MISEWILETYGSDLANAILKIILEFLVFYLFSLFGALIKENLFENKTNWKKANTIGLLTATLLFAVSNKISGILGDPRMLVGVSVFSGLLFSLFKDSIRSGNLLMGILRLAKSGRDGAIDLAIDSIKEGQDNKVKTEKEIMEDEIRRRVEERHRADIESEHRRRIAEEDRKREEDHQRYLKEEHLRREDEHLKTIEDEIERRVREELRKN